MVETVATLLCRLLGEPERAKCLSLGAWSSVLRCARHEGLAGSLAERMRQYGIWPELPDQVRAVLSDADIAVARSHVVARWEVRQALEALAPVRCPVILLKGTAYVLAGLRAGQGRSAGDLDILIPRSYLGAAEIQLHDAGWSFVHTDAYDLHYYRAWMHELPPMVHRGRGTELDVHHTIVPLTARIKPDATRMIADARLLTEGGAAVLAPEDMVLHSAAHLFYAGDHVKALRNLWDFHQLVEEFAADERFWPALAARAKHHGLLRTLAYAARYAGRLFGTSIPGGAIRELTAALPPQPLLAVMDRLFLALFQQASVEGGLKLRLAQTVLLARSHWLKMPPSLLAQHLWTKWRKRKA